MSSIRPVGDRILIKQHKAKETYGNSGIYIPESNQEKEDRGTVVSVGDDVKGKIPELLFSEHHNSHASAAFFPSPFKKSLILCMDGVGEWTTTSAWVGENNKILSLIHI